MQTTANKVPYHDGNTELEGHVVFDPSASGKRPVVLIAHAWAGQSDFERQKAEELAKLGYIGFAIDMYGKGVLGKSVDENSRLMTPFVQDRELLGRRILAGLSAVRGLPQADTSRVGAIGFCFGGMCVLDLARSGADVAGVVSFHGLLGAPGGKGGAGPGPGSIKAKVLVLHGFDDPMATPDHVVELGKELTQAGADWQVHMYGHTKHAFTNPQANDSNFGTVFDASANRRSWQAMTNFFAEIFAK